VRNRATTLSTEAYPAQAQSHTSVHAPNNWEIEELGNHTGLTVLSMPWMKIVAVEDDPRKFLKRPDRTRTIKKTIAEQRSSTFEEGLEADRVLDKSRFDGVSIATRGGGFGKRFHRLSPQRVCGDDKPRCYPHVESNALWRLSVGETMFGA
jgi:hypothetical protein